MTKEKCRRRRRQDERKQDRMSNKLDVFNEK